jgi:chromate transporter
VSGDLFEVARLFLRLGTTAFGGPAAHVAMMQDEVVERRGWMSRDDFLDLVGATNLIPGPNSTELAIHVGRRRAGWPGLLVAGACFILPAAAMVWALAWAYVRYGRLPEVAGFLYGVKPVVIAIVVQALWSLGRSALKTPALAVLAAAVTVLAIAGVHELALLFGAGVLAALLGGRLSGRAAVLVPELFLVFLKIGSVLFGSGYVLLAFLRADVVERFGWLSEAQLLDAVAVGQMTPGPVFTTATFVGYVVAGHAGAAAATVGIFLPAFVFVALSAPLVPWLRRSPTAGAFLDGVNAASLALMAVVAGQLGASAILDVPTAILALASAFALLRHRVNSSWLVLGGAIVGLVRSFSP